MRMTGAVPPLIFLSFAATTPALSVETVPSNSTEAFENHRRHLDTPIASAWTHIVKGSIAGANIEREPICGLDNCKALCLELPNCLSFEYGVDYGGSQGQNHVNTGCCRLQSAKGPNENKGEEWNLDLYVKNDCIAPVPSCPQGYNSVDSTHDCNNDHCPDTICLRSSDGHRFWKSSAGGDELHAIPQQTVQSQTPLNGICRCITTGPWAQSKSVYKKADWSKCDGGNQNRRVECSANLPGSPCDGTPLANLCSGQTKPPSYQECAGPATVVNNNMNCGANSNNCQQANNQQDSNNVNNNQVTFCRQGNDIYCQFDGKSLKKVGNGFRGTGATQAEMNNCASQAVGSIGQTTNNLCGGQGDQSANPCFAKDTTKACKIIDARANVEAAFESCYMPEARVAMPVAELVLMAVLAVGDRVLTSSPKGDLNTALVLAVQHASVYAASTMITFHMADGATLSVTPQHALFVNGELAKASDAKVGSNLTHANGREIAILRAVETAAKAVINPVTFAGTILASDHGMPVLAMTHPMPVARYIAMTVCYVNPARYVVNAAIYVVGDEVNCIMFCIKLLSRVGGILFSFFFVAPKFVAACKIRLARKLSKID